MGSSHGGGNYPNVGSSGITTEAPRAILVIDLSCDHFGANAPQDSEPSSCGSSDEGSLEPRVAPHPNLSNVPFFASPYEDVPIDSIDIPSGSIVYDEDEGVLRKGMIFNDKQHFQFVVKDYSVRHARREYRVV
ncbi:hypothetical protein ACS0TY_014404 [Phlomoides rotata]